MPDGAKVVKGGTASYGFTYKEKWSGTTRVRIGFAAADRILPYVAGGIAYAQMQGISTVTGTIAVIAPAVAAPYDDPDVANNKLKTVSGTLLDKTTMMIGYTLGGGIDYAMTDNVLVRAEYRYSDFGKKKFQDDGAEFNYKTNDFRVGVAYKF
ncbi:opacity protein-like surface antigen [Bartonella callosciuri]|uniref:Porin n=1 Tax=Bartonella callosciuri TaxID=686223 RepID=A0A840NVX2_9HYPH|nr:opacity protein-like surface antigen [Bartonella callosciuri]